MQVILAQPRGYCAGVVRAIEIVERALKKYGPPVYVRHEIVHNRYVVDNLRAKGARFVENLSDVPQGAVTISAHTAFPAPLRRRRMIATSPCSTPPAHSSPRSTPKANVMSTRAGPSFSLVTLATRRWRAPWAS